MLECTYCDSIDVECVDAHEEHYAGTTALIEEVECQDCHHTGATVTPDGLPGFTTGHIRAV